MRTDVDTALKDIADWYLKNRHSMTEAELGPILSKHCENDTEVRKFAAFLQTEPGQTRFKIHLKERKESSGEYDKPLALKLHGEMMKELKEPYGGLLTPGKFPKRDEALKKLGKVSIVEVHDDGDLTVRSGGKLYVVTTEGKTFEQTASYLKETQARLGEVHVRLWTGKVIPVKDRDEAVRVVKDELKGWMQEGDRLVWYNTEEDSKLGRKPSFAIVVNDVGEETDASAMIVYRFRSIVSPDQSLSFEKEAQGFKAMREASRLPPPSYLKEGKYVVIKSTGSTLSWESWLKDLQGYQKTGETPPDVEYPPLKCKYCGAPVPKEHLKGIEPEIWGRYHIKRHRDAVKELAAKRLPWSAGLVPVETPSYLKTETPKLICDCCGREIAPDDIGQTKIWYEPTLNRIVYQCPRCQREGRKPGTYEKPSYLKEATVLETECQLISPQYYDILTWFNVPVPDYSFAIEPEVKERKIDEVLQKLKDGVSRIHESAVFREFLTTMAKFWEYSFGNQMLIMLQRPGATRVAGFTTWKDLGRYVKAGERGIAILAPCLPPKALGCPLCGNPFTERELRTHLSEVHRRGDISTLVREAREGAVAVPTPTYFKVVYVFDVSQTEGKPLPEIAVPVLSGAFSKELYDKLMALASKQSLAVSFEPRPGQAPEIKGMLLGKDIWVKGDEPEAQRLKTLGHELAHYFTEAVYLIPRADAEVIAESVSFVVCAHSGFDTGTRSFPYVALWAKEKKVLEQNLASIRKISGRMIEELG